MSDIQRYRHLDQDDKVEFSIEDTVRKVRSLNYGTQRLLAEIVKQREADADYTKYKRFKEQTQKLRELLETDDWF